MHYVRYYYFIVCVLSPIIWSRTQYSLPQWRPANMEYFSQMSSEDLQRLIGAGGQVVHTHVLILTACCYHIPNRERERCERTPDGMTPFIFHSINVIDRNITAWWELLWLCIIMYCSVELSPLPPTLISSCSHKDRGTEHILPLLPLFCLILLQLC